jgi:hypothetical protein
MQAIAELYQQFDPMRPLTAAGEADQALYVDWQRQLGGDDVKLRLARGIARSGGQAVIHLFTGPRGVGKTTELYRVRHLLEEGMPGKRFFVSMLMAEAWLDLADFQPEELSFQMIRQLVTDLREAGFKPSGVVGEFFLKLGMDFNKKLGLDAVEIGHDPLRFTFKYQNVPYNRRREFRELLQGQLPRIYDLVNDQLITEARRWLSEREGVDDILMIVDEIDRIPLLGENHEQLFIGRAGTLRALDCHILYTIPIELAYSPRQAALRDIYGTEILTLPVRPLLDPAGNVHSVAQNALREIVERRVTAAALDLDKTFENHELLVEVLYASGGHVRTLFVLLRSMLDRAERLPITRTIVQRSLRGTAADLARPLSKYDWSILEQVNVTKQQTSGIDIDAWNRLLRDSYVLTYYQEDAGYWYDRNPLLNYIEMRNRP